MNAVKKQKAMKKKSNKSEKSKPFKFQPKTPFVAVDAVVKSRKGVALIKRKFWPYTNHFCLPGGFVEIGESCEDAVKREVKEELGIKVKIKKLIGVYSPPKRDPRFHAITIAYLCEALSKKLKLKAGDDAAKAEWHKKMPKKIGFDHR